MIDSGTRETRKARMHVEYHYQANFTKGSLLVPESRIVAKLLLEDISGKDWTQIIATENVLQKRTQNTANTHANLARSRLKTMGPKLWKLVSNGSSPVATHAVLAATIKFSPLLGDFMNLALKEEFKRFEEKLRPTLWDNYLDACRDRDPNMPKWTEGTRAKLKQNAFRILAEAGFLTDTRSKRLNPVPIAPEVISYLEDHKEAYVLQCIQVTR